MTKRCATLSEFLAQAPEFAGVGPGSRGTFTLAAQPSPGDSVTIADTLSFPPVSETLVAGADFAIGADETETAINLAAAFAGSGLADAASVGAVVYVSSKTTGPQSLYAMVSTNTTAIVPSGPALEGGDAIVAAALETACCSINLECWGKKASAGSVYLAGFYLSVQTGIGAGGEVKRKKIDKLEVEFQTGTPSDGELSTNKWGRLYLQLRKSLLILPVAGRGLYC